MARLKLFLLLQFVFFSALPVIAQVDTAWVRRYNGPGYGSDGPRALAMDNSGNVYVTGYSSGSGTATDYATIKYAPNGDSLWVRLYNGPGNGDDRAFALVADDSGNVYVTGFSSGSGTNTDYATIKYAPNGDTLWVRRYNGPGNGNDIAYALALDDSGNVYVTGSSWGSGTFYDYATIKYAPNGDSLWVRRYNGVGNGYDDAEALAVDRSGNVYVTGGSGTIKYSANGDSLWLSEYGGIDIAMDDSSNVYVTGSIDSDTAVNIFNIDYATIKFAPNGDTLWVRRYNGPGIGSDYPSALEVDGSGNVYVTGYSSQYSVYPYNEDYATIKYAPNGDTVWVRRYNGPGNDYDKSKALAVDSSGNAYVTGSSLDSDFFLDYATIKYSTSGDTLWIRRYSGQGAGDEAYATAVDDSGNVYVTGASIIYGTGYDYATIKYVQLACIAKSGDANSDENITLPDIVFLVNRVFKAGPAPTPLCRGDANADSAVTLPDIIYLVNRVFKGGPAPVKSLECCL